LREDTACGLPHLALQLSPRGGELYCPLQDGESPTSRPIRPLYERLDPHL